MAVHRQVVVGGRAVGSVGYGMLGRKRSQPVEWGEYSLKAYCNSRLTIPQSTHYGTPDSNSVHLIRDYFNQYPEDASKVVLTLKGAFDHQKGPDGTPEGIRASVYAAYDVLKGIKSIDTFAMGRVDPKVPIETSIRTLAELVKEGKIGGIGLSEVSASTIRRAQAIHQISVVEIELSLFTPDPLQNGIVDACHQCESSVQALSSC
ncbi:hypothetical protein MRB53_041710 [Persea americana]|nr:hypothetical protein MRB53_041710 [Persea americana]